MVVSPFAAFGKSHSEVLEATFREPDWHEVQQEGLLDAARSDLLTPPKTINAYGLPALQLERINEPKVRQLIAAGERDEGRLLAILGAWPESWPDGAAVSLSFLGINLGFRCDMAPRCVYCNQEPVANRMTLADWKGLIRSLATTDGEGTYISITGGEPLLFGERLWGQEGLVKEATQAGAACNVNTNALALTPRAAVGLVSSGLARMHVSLDSHQGEVQDSICRQSGRWRQVIRGICNLQIAKALLGAEHPIVHINCVLTRQNADDFPGLLRFLLDMKPLSEGRVNLDFDMHVIPVGGVKNDGLRLTAEGYRRFFAETWPEADALWRGYQIERGVPEEQRRALHESVPFLSPFHRVRQRGDLLSWAERAAAGLPASLALTEQCYVAPTQGFVLPDGSQYWCGGHTVSRPEPVGNVKEGSAQENLRSSLSQVGSYPSEHCRNCAGATQAINQAVEARLRQTIREWLTSDSLSPADEQPSESSRPPGADFD